MPRHETRPTFLPVAGRRNTDRRDLRTSIPPAPPGAAGTVRPPPYPRASSVSAATSRSSSAVVVNTPGVTRTPRTPAPSIATVQMR